MVVSKGDKLVVSPEQIEKAGAEAAEKYRAGWT